MALASADDPEEALEEELVRLTSVGVALRERKGLGAASLLMVAARRKPS